MRRRSFVWGCLVPGLLDVWEIWDIATVATGVLLPMMNYSAHMKEQHQPQQYAVTVPVCSTLCSTVCSTLCNKEDSKVFSSTVHCALCIEQSGLFWGSKLSSTVCSPAWSIVCSTVYSIVLNTECSTAYSTVCSAVQLKYSVYYRAVQFPVQCVIE